MTSVLTGDIVNSRNISSTIWLNTLKTIFNSIGKNPMVWEIYRGDSFQIEIENIQDALSIALKIKYHLKKTKNLDVRIAIGIGRKNSYSPKITEANGEAFINSGRAFDTLKKQLLIIKSPWKNLDEELNLAIDLALLTMNSWTPNSAEIIQISIENPTFTQKKISTILGITQGRVSERQKRAGLKQVLKLEKRYRKLIKQKIKSE